MFYILSEHFTGIFIFFLMILNDLSHSNISVFASFYNSSEEIKDIFSHSHATDSISKGKPVTGNFAEGGLIDESFNQNGSKNFINNSSKNVSNNLTSVPAFTSLLNKQNVSSSVFNKSNTPLQTSSIKTSLSTKLVETGSDLFLGVPEVIHVNGTSSIKPRKGVHYSNIVPRKGVDNENEALHVSLENQSCFWLSEKECYSNKGMECNCCKEGNVLGENVKQAPVNCKNCKTFNKISPEQNQTCGKICCTAVNNNFYSVSTTQNNYQNESTTEKRQQNMSHAELSGNIKHGNDSLEAIGTNNYSVSFETKLKLKPHITKVPYDAESMTELLGQAQEKVFVPLAVSLFLLPLMGIFIFFLWQKTKEYWNKRYYKRMDFLIDGIYND